MTHPISTPVTDRRLVPALRADVDQLKKLVAILAASSDNMRGELIPQIQKEISGLQSRTSDAAFRQQLDELNEKVATIAFLDQRVNDLEAKVKKSDAFANDLLVAQNAARSAQEQIQSFSDRLLAVEVQVEAHDASLKAIKSWRHDIVDPTLNRLDSQHSAMAKAIASIRSDSSGISWALFAGLTIGTFFISWWIIAMLLEEWNRPNQLGLAGLFTVLVVIVAHVLGVRSGDSSTAVTAAAGASASTGTTPAPPAPASVTTSPSGGGGTPTQVQPRVAVGASASAGARSSS